MDATLLIGFVLGLLVMLMFGNRRKSKLPPSRLTLPYIGTPTLLAKLPGTRPHEIFTEEAKYFGNIFSFSVANKLVVVLNGYDAIHEALVKNAATCSGRLEDLNKAMNITGKEVGEIFYFVLLMFDK